MSAGSKLVANVLPVEFGSEVVAGWRRRLTEADDVEALRASQGDVWNIQWQAGDLYFLPIADDARQPDGTETVELKISDELQLLARLVTNSLVRRFPMYDPLRKRPFTFLGQRNELMNGAAKAIGADHELLGTFRIWPKYALDARVFELRPGEPFIGITVDLSTRWEITADLAALAGAGVDLTGLYVVHRVADPDHRRLAGRVVGLAGTKVLLEESTSGQESIDAAGVMLEGRKEAFARCLKVLLRDAYGRYEAFRDQRTGQLLGAKPFLDELRRVASLLGSSPLTLCRGLECTVRNPLVVSNANGYQTVASARRLDYCFDPARTKTHRYAWPGLETYGPFSRDTFARPSPSVLVLFPQAAKGATEAFVRQLRDGVRGHKAFASGMTKVFGLVNPRFELLPVVQGPGQSPAEAYRRAITQALGNGELPDAALIVIADAEGALPDPENPYLHSKALLLMAGVASQEVRISTITRRPAELQYVLQNVATALYAKMRGVPWTVDHDLTIADELVIGIGTAELSNSRAAARQRYIGITTVFRGDGNYLLGQLSREATYDEYPQVLRDATRDAIDEIKRRNGWQQGDTVRLVFHAARPPRNVHFARLMLEAVEAVRGEQHIEAAFLTVSHDHPLVLFDEAQQGKQTGRGTKGELRPERGLIMQSGRYSRLLATTGPTLVKRAGLPMSRPLQVHLRSGSTFTDLHYLSEQALKFTSLSWRSTQPAADPVTIYYSELIARLLGRLKAIPDWSPALLDARLRNSKWFI